MSKRTTLATILKAIMQNPKGSDREIAKAVKVSQPTVTRARTKLLEGRIFKYAAIPLLNQLGYEVLGITEIDIPENQKALLFEKLHSEKEVIVAIQQISSVYVVSVHKTLEAFYDFIRSYYANIVLLSTPKSIVKDFDFSSLSTEDLKPK